MRRILGVIFCLLFCFFPKKPVLAGETESEAVLSEMENAFFSELNLNELDETLKTGPEFFGDGEKTDPRGTALVSGDHEKTGFQRFF